MSLDLLHVELDPPDFSDLGLVTRGNGQAWAVFSQDEVYRYALGRIWNPDAALLVGCFLNPSRATHKDTDPTLKKFCHYARRTVGGRGPEEDGE